MAKDWKLIEVNKALIKDLILGMYRMVVFEYFDIRQEPDKGLDNFK